MVTTAAQANQRRVGPGRMALQQNVRGVALCPAVDHRVHRLHGRGPILAAFAISFTNWDIVKHPGMGRA